MTAKQTALAALLLVLASSSGAYAILSPSGVDSRLQLEWDVGKTPSGRPQVQGYIYNSYMRAAINVRLLIETLDDKGQVVATTYGFVFGAVPAFSRAPFDVPLK